MEEGESSKEYNEDGKYGKNGKEVRLGMITQEEELGGGKGEEEEEEYRISWRLGVTIYIAQ
jgi:hypothetical protein